MLRVGVHQQPKYRRSSTGSHHVVGYYFTWYVYGSGQDESNALAKGTSRTKEAALRAGARAKRKLEYATKGVNDNPRARRAKKPAKYQVIAGRVFKVA